MLANCTTLIWRCYIVAASECSCPPNHNCEICKWPWLCDLCCEGKACSHHTNWTELNSRTLANWVTRGSLLLMWQVTHHRGQICKAKGAYDTIYHFACSFAKYSPVLKILSPPNCMINLYTESKKTRNLTPVRYFAKCLPIFKKKFTARLSSKFVIELHLNISPLISHLWNIYV